jgi:hypothetical protein
MSLRSDTLFWFRDRQYLLFLITNKANLISDAMISMLVSSAVDRRFQPRAGQAKDYKIGFCCFNA